MMLTYPYTCNSSEEYVNNMYREIGIHHPHQLVLEEIAARNGISIFHLPTEPMNIETAIVLDSRTSEPVQWQDFGHELCHALWHAGNQAVLPISMTEYQEWRANSFAFNLCVPSFMLDQADLPAYEREAIWLIMEKFGVDCDFARQRLELYLRNRVFR